MAEVRLYYFENSPEAGEVYRGSRLELRLGPIIIGLDIGRRR